MDIYEDQIKKFFYEIWNDQNFHEIENVLHTDINFRSAFGQETHGYNKLIDYINHVHSTITNHRCVVEGLVIQPDKVFAKMIYTSTHHSEVLNISTVDKELSWTGAALFTFNGGKIIKIWINGDVKILERKL